MEEWVYSIPLFKILMNYFDMVIFLNKSEAFNLELCKTILKSETSFIEVISHLSPDP